MTTEGKRHSEINGWLKVMVPVVLGVIGYTGVSIWNHDTRLTTIEASRYTAKDAEVDREKQQQRWDVLMGRLAKIESNLAVLVAGERRRGGE